MNERNQFKKKMKTLHITLVISCNIFHFRICVLSYNVYLLIASLSYTVGYIAWFAIPHMLSWFRDIIIYPSIPQEVPQLKKITSLINKEQQNKTKPYKFEVLRLDFSNVIKSQLRWTKHRQNKLSFRSDC